MQFRDAVLALLFSSIASSIAILSNQADPKSLNTVLYKVPGINPFVYCADPSNYIGQIEYIDLSPNPPVKGETLSIKANGTFTEDILPGAKIHLQVKFKTYITLINTVQDVCDNLPRVDLECPLEKGPLSVSKEVKIPAQVPPGEYEVLADVYTESGKKIACMNAKVSF